MGLDQTELFLYGAAPLRESTVDYFASIDIPIMNFYGLTETSGSAVAQSRGNMNLATAGKALSGTTIKIRDPDEHGVGEILVKGRHIMMGYLNNETETKPMFDEQGFFRTGDLGVLDAHGYLHITGRKKEIIITAGGENVVPGPIEDTFKMKYPACGHIMVVGEKQRFITALITLKVDIDSAGNPTDNLAKEAIKFLQKETGEYF